jgi:hypothetical protein
MKRFRRLGVFSSVTALSAFLLAPGCGSEPPPADPADGSPGTDALADAAKARDARPVPDSGDEDAFAPDVKTDADAAVTCAAPRGFSGPPAVTTSGWATDVFLVDLNGDGKDELVVGTSGATNSVAVYRSTGSGTFSLSDTYPLPFTTDVRVAEVNGDRRPDIVLGTGKALLNDGTGRFPTTAQLPTSGSWFVVGDVNADGKADFAAASGSIVTVTLSNATGYAPAVDYDTGAQAGWMALRDLDGNGRADLVVSHPTEGTLSVRLEASGAFPSSQTDLPIGTRRPRASSPLIFARCRIDTAIAHG